MFSLTDDEKSALENESRLRTALTEAAQALHSMSYHDGTERVTAKEAHAAAQKAVAEAQLAETFLVATLKAEANKAIAEKLPGGSYGALLTLAEQTLSLVATEGGIRTVNLVKSAALMLLQVAADPDIHQARARITKARYDALLNVGLPVDLVHEILVAEASRPWSFPRASASAKR